MDHIEKYHFYINLRERTEKNKNTIEELKRFGIHSPNRFEAIKHEIGIVGCVKSHIRCIELAKEMTTNIRKTPLSGIGFGIGSSPREMNIARDPYFDLPISAPIEKGIMPLAILEEVGILGAILVFSWFAIMFRRAWQSGPTQFIVISTAFMVNLGQNIFFSTGGLGLLVILLVTWSIAPRPLNKNISKQKNIG